MKSALPEKLPNTFNELARFFVPHAITGDTDYDRTVAEMNRIAVLDKRTPGQRQYLDTLALLVEAYDRRHHAIDTSDLHPLDLLKSFLKDHDLSASDLGRFLGNRELGSKILRGKRELSKAHILILSDRFKVSPSVFMERPRKRYRQAS
jgi:HTH-type transcriptional regulator / antitoxin HigA